MMTLLALLFALLWQRSGPAAPVWPEPAAAYVGWWEARLPRAWRRSPQLALLTVLAPPLLAVALVQGLLEDALWNILALVFAVLVLVQTLGMSRLEALAGELLATGGRVVVHPAGQHLDAGWAAPEAAGAETAADTLVSQALHELFSVIFWFILLGPLGAVLVRANGWIAAAAVQEDTDPYRLAEAAAALAGILAWLPARLLAASFLLVGSFEEGLGAWRERGNAAAPERLAGAVAAGALRLNAGFDEAPAASDAEHLAWAMRAALGLIWRALVLWLALLALTSVAYYAG